MFKTKNLLLVILLALTTSGFAQKLQMQKTKILLLVDASNSMVQQWENRTKIDAIRLQLTNFIDKCSEYGEIEFALRLFGNDYEIAEKNCTDSKLEIPFSSQNSNKIKIELNQINPIGLSCISFAIDQIANDFEKETFHKKIIIVITDGPDACNKSIATSYQSLKSKIQISGFYCLGIDIPNDALNEYTTIENFINITSEQSLKNECDKLFSKIKPY